MRCFFFGCWNEAGHYMFAPGKQSVRNDSGLAYYIGADGERVHIDGSLAPRKYQYGGQLCWVSGPSIGNYRSRIDYRSEEYPQGQFLRHLLSNGYTAIQWWDRCQGDTRGACNSTVLLEGERTSDEMLTALREHFPHVLANLERHGVQLVDVTPAAATKGTRTP